MKASHRMKRAISLLLAVSGLFSWAGPSHALKPAETVEGSGLEELDRKLRSTVSSASGLEEWQAIRSDQLPAGLWRDLGSYGMQVEKVEYAKIRPPDTGGTVSQPFAHDGAAAAIPMSVNQALGSVLFKGLGEEYKVVADGNAVFMGFHSLVDYSLRHPREAVLVLGDEGERDSSIALRVGSLVLNGRIVPFHGMETLRGELRKLLQEGVTLRGIIGDALEVTNAFVEGKPNSWGVVALVDLPQSLDALETLFLIPDRLRRAGYVYHAPKPAEGLSPFDLPEEGFRKIALAQGIDPNDPAAFGRWMAQRRQATLLGKPKPRPFLEPARSQGLALAGRYPGFETFYPDDGDLFPAILAAMGLEVDGHILTTITRHGSNEGFIAAVAANDVQNAQFLHTFVSVKKTERSSVLSKENGHNFDDPEERAVGDGFGIKDDRLKTIDTRESWPHKGLIAMSSVTGASRELAGQWAQRLKAVEFLRDSEGLGGRVVVHTFVLAQDGSATVVRTTFKTDDLPETQEWIKLASRLPAPVPPPLEKPARETQTLEQLLPVVAIANLSSALQDQRREVSQTFRYVLPEQLAQTLQEFGIGYHLTFLHPGQIGTGDPAEFNRTRGHFHSQPYGELVEVYDGRGSVLLWRIASSNDPGIATDAVRLSVRAGDQFFVPAGWAHLTVNESLSQMLVFGTWLRGDVKLVYEPVRRVRGGPWYIGPNGYGPNANYGHVPSLMMRVPNRPYLENSLGIPPERSIWSIALTDPVKFRDIMGHLTKESDPTLTAEDLFIPTPASGLEENVMLTQEWAASVMARVDAGEIEVVERGAVRLTKADGTLTRAAVHNEARAVAVQMGGWFLPVLNAVEKRLTLSPPKLLGPAALTAQSNSRAITAIVENRRAIVLKQDGQQDLPLEPFPHGSIVGLAFGPGDGLLAAWSRPTPKLEVWDLAPLVVGSAPRKLTGVAIRAADHIGFNTEQMGSYGPGTLISIRSSPRRVSWWDPAKGAFLKSGLEEQPEIMNRLMSINKAVELVTQVRQRGPGYEGVERMWVHVFGEGNDEDLRDPAALQKAIQAKAGSSPVLVSVIPQNTRRTEVQILIGPQRSSGLLSTNTWTGGDLGHVTFKPSEIIPLLRARADFRLRVLHLEGWRPIPLDEIDPRTLDSTIDFVVAKGAFPENPDQVMVTIAAQGKEAWIGYQNDPRLSDVVQTEMPAKEAADRILQRGITDWWTGGERASTNTYDLADRSKDWSPEQWIQRILLQLFMMEVKLAYSPNGQVQLLRAGDEPLPGFKIVEEKVTVGTADRYLRNPPEGFPPVRQLLDREGNVVLDFTPSLKQLDIQKAVYQAMENWPVRVTLLGKTAYAGENASAWAGVHRLLRISKAVDEILGDSKVRWLHVDSFGTLDRAREEFPFSQANLEGLLKRIARDGKVLLTIQGDEAWVSSPASGLEETPLAFVPMKSAVALQNILNNAAVGRVSAIVYTVNGVERRLEGEQVKDAALVQAAIQAVTVNDNLLVARDARHVVYLASPKLSLIFISMKPAAAQKNILSNAAVGRVSAVVYTVDGVEQRLEGEQVKDAALVQAAIQAVTAKDNLLFAKDAQHIVHLAAPAGLEEKIVPLYAPAPVISVAWNRPGHEVQMAALTQDGQALAYSSSGARHEYRRDILSDARTSRPALSAPIPGALRVAFRAGGAGIFVGGANGGVTFDAFYQAQSRQHPVRLGETGIHPLELPPGRVALSPDRKRLLVTAGGHQARIWNMAPEDELLFSSFGPTAAGLVAELTLDRGNISAVGYGPHGFIALGTDDGRIEIRRITDETVGTTRPIATLQRHIGPVTAVRFSPSGKYLASADRNGRIILWDTESWKPLREMSHPAGSAVVVLEFHGRHEVDRKDGQLKFRILSLASAGDDGVIRFWDHHSGQLQSELAIQPETRVNTLAFSWDGTRLIAGLQRPIGNSFAVMAKVPSPKSAGLEEGPVHVVLSNGRTKLAAGVNDFNGPIGELDENQPPPVSVAWDSVKEIDLAGRSPLERSLSVFGDTVEEALKFHGISADRLEQVGMATTGFGDFSAGVIMMENLPDHGLAVMQDLKMLFERELQRRFGRPIPVVFFNDGVAGVLGEHNLPEGALHDVQDGIFVIVGGGVGSGEMEGGKPVYAVPGVIEAFLNEIGWHIVTIDGGTTWVWRGEGATQTNLVPNPASGPNEWSLEQHMGGPFLAARAVQWMQDRGRGDVFGEEIVIQMDSKQNLSKTDRPVVSSVEQQTLVLKKITELGRQGDVDALEFIRDSGRALGAGLGAFRQRFQDRAFARGRVAIGSSVGEKFGMGIDGDPFLTEVKKAIGTEDVVRALKTGVKREWAFSMPQKPATGPETLWRTLQDLNANNVFWSAKEVDLNRQARPVLIDASEDARLDSLALALSVMMARDNVPEMDFRIVIPSARVPELQQQLRRAGAENALPFLQPRIFAYEAVSTIGAVREQAVGQMAEQFGFGSAQELRDSGLLRVENRWSPDLAANLRAFFTAGGLNFVTDEAYQRFEAVLKSA